MITFVKVTKEDIRLGTPGYATACPVARALKRKFLRDTSTAHSFSAIENISFAHDSQLIKWVRKFDRWQHHPWIRRLLCRPITLEVNETNKTIKVADHG